MEVKEGLVTTSRTKPDTDLDRFAIEVAETAEAAIGYVFDDKWKATPIIAVSEKDDKAYPAAIILENITLEPADESMVRDFKLKIASMISQQADQIKKDAEKKYHK